MSARSIALQGIGSGALLTALQGFGPDQDVASGGGRVYGRSDRKLRRVLDRNEALDDSRRVKEAADRAVKESRRLEVSALASRAEVLAAKAALAAPIPAQAAATKIAESTVVTAQAVGEVAGEPMDTAESASALAARKQRNNRRRAAVLAALLLLE